MGILRFAVVGAAVFMLMPTPPQETSAGSEQAAQAIQTEDLLSAAFGTFTDLASFCSRQPQTCEAMGSVAAVAEAKAKYSFKLAYEWANGRSGAQAGGTADDSDAMPAHSIPGLLNAPTETGDAEATTIRKQSAVDPMITGSTFQVASDDTGTNTLRIDDLIPDWRGPAPVGES